MFNLIRYPGSKAKLHREIVKRFAPSMAGELFSRGCEYREPFFGSGALGLRVLDRLDASCRVWLNDVDPGIAALWQAVYLHPRELIAECRQFNPTVEAFYEFKDLDGQPADAVTAGFRKLALHRLSFSGLGYMAGGPLGGRDQQSQYTVGCRWNRPQIVRAITDIHALLARFTLVRITCGDYAPLLTEPGNAFVYLDPPYYEKGPELYKHSMDDADHVRLRNLLKQTRAEWLLSYDDHPRVRDLYTDCKFLPVHVTYTMATTAADTPKRPKNCEVLISKE